MAFMRRSQARLWAGGKGRKHASCCRDNDFGERTRRPPAGFTVAPKPEARRSTGVSQIIATNPATGEQVGSYPETDAGTLSDILEGARRAQLEWKRRSFEERAVPLHAAGALLRERSTEIAELIAREMGKPVKDGA